MKLTRIFINGFIIFVGIGLYFLLLESLGLAHVFILRLLNVAFVVYGVNRTIKANYEDGVKGYNRNFLQAFLTSEVGAVLSISGLLAYIYIRGGEPFLKELATHYLFGGGDLTIQQYCIGLLIEANAASLIVSFCLMQYWKDKVEVINRVD